MIPYGKQDISEQDIASVVEVLQSDFLTQGPQVPLFENAIKQATTAQYACAVNSATSALHIACMALDVGPGDIVWTSPITFVASANCALYCGASIDFVDIDPQTYLLCPHALETKLAHAKRNHALPKVIIPVHLGGQSCAMPAIYALAKEYGVKIIEDASHCIGAQYQDKPVGACTYSDITVFSFHPVKIVTSAEGGAAVTNCAELAQRLELLRSHGVTRDESQMDASSVPDSHAQTTFPPWYYQQIALGYNYRMTDLHAALGLSQMQRLTSFIRSRQHLASRYNELLADLPVLLPTQHPDTQSSWHLYIIRLRLAHDTQRVNNLTHSEVFSALRERGIGVNLHYIPVHLQPFYQRLGFAEGDFPVAEAYYETAISIPLFHGMTDAQQDEVVLALRDVLLV